MKILFCNVLILLSCLSSFSQLVEYPLGSHQFSSKRNHPNAKTAATPLTLPFWDDFSYDQHQANPQLWQNYQTVLLNNGVGIKPPTKNVVTFDGVDSVGHPYSVTNILDKGLADSLVSQPIALATAVPPALRNTVYLSFFFQVRGNGESPDPGDLLIISCKNSSQRWVTMRTVEVSDDLDPTLFYQISIPISDDQFYHDAFQIKFQNFARLSGPYDTWSVDYVYLNKNRSPSDTSFPDRAISTSMTSLFNDYFSMPARHFLQNPAANLKHPMLTLYNLKAGNQQPIDYSTKATITTKIGTQTPSTSVIPLDVAASPSNLLNGLQYLDVTLNTIPPTTAFNPLADSISVLLKFGVTSKDNIPIPAGDYDPSVYSPIDFRTNDTIQSRYTLSSYYAYDDGQAEYGAGLNQSGAYFANKFLLKFSQPDTLVYVDIYFPEFGDNTSQSVQLEIRSDLSDTPSSILYQQSVVVKRTTQNQFTRYSLEPNVVVAKDFYVGWKQLASVSIPAGLDKNTDNGDKLFFNTNGAWEQNIAIKGSMMIHPGIGVSTTGIPVGLEKPIDVNPIYPNPTSRTCYLPLEAESVMVFDIAGRRIEAEMNTQADRQSLTLLSPSPGLIIVRYFLQGKVRTEKIMVREE